MKVTAIRIRKLVSRPTGYGHDAAEIEAAVEPGEDPLLVAQMVHTMVDAEIRQGREVTALRETLDDLRSSVVSLTEEATTLRADIQQMRREVNNAEAFIQAALDAGLDVPAFLRERLLPF